MCWFVFKRGSDFRPKQYQRLISDLAPPGPDRKRKDQSDVVSLMKIACRQCKGLSSFRCVVGYEQREVRA